MIVEAPAPMRHLRVLLYADVNLNYLDGSAIWLQSITEALDAVGHHVTVLLKNPVVTDRITGPLARLANVELVEPTTRLDHVTAAARLRALDAKHAADVLVVRGLAVAETIAVAGAFDGRMWSYITDLPQHVSEAADAELETVRRVVASSSALLCQTDDLRGFLEQTVPAASGKSHVLGPAVPVTTEPAGDGHPTPDRPVSLVYAGKFASSWRTLEMCGLPAALGARGLDAELTMLGDKINADPENPDFADRMQAALESTPGVRWLGGLPRADAMARVAAADFGLAWRAPDLDSSLELSTKLLEYGALGIPAILNPTPAHVDLLGWDYPLFVRDEDEVVAAVASCVADPDRYRLARKRCQQASAGFAASNAVDTLRALTHRYFPSRGTVAGGKKTKVVVAGHDLKFFTRLMEHLGALPDVELRVDKWKGLVKNDPKQTARLSRWADVVICEWLGRNAVWYSHNKRRGQRLIVRLHRAELYTDLPREIDIDAVDQIVCVSPHYAALAREKFGWPDEKVTVIPNWVDGESLRRRKRAGARFRLGMVGIVPHRKRFDLGLEVLRKLRTIDSRFTLSVKSKMPWDYNWVWREADERRHAQETFERLASDPDLASAVTFDGFGPDVGAWLRGIGFMLSTSDDESFHLAPAEAMASGAVPVIRDWPGADTIYDPYWIHGSVDEMVRTIADRAAGPGWEADVERATHQVLTAFDLPTVAGTWVDILEHNLPTDRLTRHLSAPGEVADRGR
jgi:glycosyltransferase involved in cell wall biosynthesis